MNDKMAAFILQELIYCRHEDASNVYPKWGENHKYCTKCGAYYLPSQKRWFRSSIAEWTRIRLNMKEEEVWFTPKDKQCVNKHPHPGHIWNGGRNRCLGINKPEQECNCNLVLFGLVIFKSKNCSQHKN